MRRSGRGPERQESGGRGRRVRTGFRNGFGGLTPIPALVAVNVKLSALAHLGRSTSAVNTTSRRCPRSFIFTQPERGGTSAKPPHTLLLSFFQPHALSPSTISSPLQVSCPLSRQAVIAVEWRSSSPSHLLHHPPRPCPVPQNERARPDAGKLPWATRSLRWSPGRFR